MSQLHEYLGTKPPLMLVDMLDHITEGHVSSSEGMRELHDALIDVLTDKHGVDFRA